MDKIEINSFHMSKVLDHYRLILYTKFPNRIITKNFLESAQTFIDQYQQICSKRETNIVWKIPVKVIGDPRTCNLDVELANPESIQLVN